VTSLLVIATLYIADVDYFLLFILYCISHGIFYLTL